MQFPEVALTVVVFFRVYLKSLSQVVVAWLNSNYQLLLHPAFQDQLLSTIFWHCSWLFWYCSLTSALCQMFIQMHPNRFVNYLLSKPFLIWQNHSWAQTIFLCPPFNSAVLAVADFAGNIQPASATVTVTHVTVTLVTVTTIRARRQVIAALSDAPPITCFLAFSKTVFIFYIACRLPARSTSPQTS